jgi:hypothetical protein
MVITLTTKGPMPGVTKEDRRRVIIECSAIMRNPTDRHAVRRMQTLLAHLKKQNQLIVRFSDGAPFCASVQRLQMVAQHLLDLYIAF